MLLKVIACEVALREVCHLVARSPHVIDVEFLAQGLHDHPAQGRQEIQERLDAQPAGHYDAVLLGYGLCSSILTGLRAGQTQLVVPRAHDCITFFLGSKERYQERFAQQPGTYYFTSGWVECRRRRGDHDPGGFGGFMAAQAGPAQQATYAQWVARYGEEQARYLAETMAQWSSHYTHGALIDFDFTRPLGLRAHVQKVCGEQGWAYEELGGDLGLLRRWLDADWNDREFLVVPPGREMVATFDGAIIGLAPVAAGAPVAPAVKAPPGSPPPAQE
jgi:hypothetical protein